MKHLLFGVLAVILFDALHVDARYRRPWRFYDYMQDYMRLPRGAKICPKCEGTGVTQEEAMNMCSSSFSPETCSFQSAVCAVKDVLGDDNSHTVTRSCMSAMSFEAETSFTRQNARCKQLVANDSAGKCVMGKCESDNCKAQLPAL